MVRRREGAPIMGISNALYGNITVKEGWIEQSNDTDYLVARIEITPETHSTSSKTRTRRAASANRRAADRTCDLQCDLSGYQQTDPGLPVDPQLLKV
jgi:hypothetical protein